MQNAPGEIGRVSFCVGAGRPALRCSEAGAAGSLDQGRERFSLLRLVSLHHFRVPLHCEDEGGIWNAERFDHTIWGDTIDGEPLTNSVDGLVVEGIHREV